MKNKNFYNLIFFLMLILSSIISISSNSWMGLWMGLEMNLISFIPLMMMNKNLKTTESMLIYFLTQAMASTILFLMIIMSLMKFINNDMLLIYIFLPILIKIGSAPFHFWFPMVMENLNWIISSILVIWQKLAPMIIISYLKINMLKIFIIFSVIIGAIGGFNQISLRKIMAFSSINHIGWMFISLQMSNLLWKIYYLLYSFLTISMIMIFFNFNLFYLFQMFFFNNKNNFLKLCLFLNILSLGGLPPFLGFFPKFIIIQNLMFNFQMFMLMILFLTTLITLFFYLRISYSSFLFNHLKIKKLIVNNQKFINLWIITFLNMIGFWLMFFFMKFIF